jgi:hypothetical protein
MLAEWDEWEEEASLGKRSVKIMVGDKEVRFL